MKNTVLLLILLFVVGCQQPTYKYRIDLVTPHGKVHKTWYVSSVERPRIMKRLGGQSNVMPRTLGIEAPTGWLLDITKEGEL